MRVANFLRNLGTNPPPSLLLEGGSAHDRLQLALYWAARVNCGQPNAPCLACSICEQIINQILRDLIVLDGRAEPVSVDMMRDMRAGLGDAPVAASYRVIILAEAQNLHPAAANALLKSMEEPLPGNIFVLTVPQRENILPTLVSRSIVLTLAWQYKEADEPTLENLAALTNWLQSGTGLFDQKSRKDSLSKDSVENLFLALQRNLLDAFCQKSTSCFSGLQNNLAALREIDLLLHESLEALAYNVNPVLVHDRTALRLYETLHRKPQ